MDTIKRAPKELRRIELGQLYNATTNQFLAFNCIDLKKAWRKDILRFNNDEVLEIFKFSHENDSETSNSALNVGGAVKGAGWGVKLAAAYNHYNEKAESTKRNTIKGDVYKVKTASMQFFNIINEPSVLIECLRETTFKKDWENVKTQVDAVLKQKEIIKFKAKWGTGLIVKVDFIAGASAQIEFKSDSKDKREANVHEAELNIESYVVSAEGKFSLKQEISGFNLNVSQVGQTICFPTEVDSYKNYIDENVKYVKNYIEKKEVSADKPKFVGVDGIESIKISDLKLTEKSTPEEDAEKSELDLQKAMAILKRLLNFPNDNNLVKAYHHIRSMEDDLLSLYDPKNEASLSEFNELKVVFESEIIELKNQNELSKDLQKLVDKQIPKMTVMATDGEKQIRRKMLESLVKPHIPIEPEVIEKKEVI